jgi:hypothetical protein
MNKHLKSILLLGAQSPMAVAFPGRPTHFYYFHVGEMLWHSQLEEVKSAIKEADVIYSFLSEEEAEVLGRALNIKVPKRNLIRLEAAFLTLGVEEPRKIYLITVHWEECPLVHRVWISSTMGD